MKYTRYLVALCVAAGALGLATLALKHPTVQPSSKDASPSATQNAGLPMHTITIGKNTLTVEVASNNAQREQGLSDRASLAQGRGMLFVFDPPKTVGFWMKDMRFSLDIIFADQNGAIKQMYTNVAPETYPHIFPSGFPARYVLEIPAGYAAAHGIAIGQKIVVQ